MKKLKRFYWRVRHCFMLLGSNYYTVVLDDGHGDVLILGNCCTTCNADRLDFALSVLEDMEDEDDQADAVDLANKIIANKN